LVGDADIVAHGAGSAGKEGSDHLLIDLIPIVEDQCRQYLSALGRVVFKFEILEGRTFLMGSGIFMRRQFPPVMGNNGASRVTCAAMQAQIDPIFKLIQVPGSKFRHNYSFFKTFPG
jgi:hypothetical protein